MAKVTEQMTAVEWLIQQEFSNDYFSNETINKAKRMHKQQTVDAYKHGQNNGYNYRGTGKGYIEGEEYFEQTFTTQAQ